MPRTLLLLRADDIAVTNDDVVAFESVCATIGVTVTTEDVHIPKDVEEALSGSFNYICFADHGDEENFGDNDSLSISWNKITELVCELDCLAINGIVLLCCCKGGALDVGCTLIDYCPKLDFVMGPPEESDSRGLLISYMVFLYNYEINKLSEEDAIHRAINGTGVQIDHFYKSHRNEQTGEFYCPICEEQGN